MKKLFLFSVLLSLLSCEDSKNKISPKLIANEKGEIYIALVTDRYNKNSFDLTVEEVNRIDSLLIQAVKQMEVEYSEIANQDGNKKKFVIDLSTYKRQYSAYINGDGEKEVYVNCFCNQEYKGNWKKDAFRVYGGGVCYFSGVVNLKTNKASHFSINAPE